MNEEAKQPLEFKPHKFKDKIVIDRSIFEAYMDITEKKGYEEGYCFLQGLFFYAFCPDSGYGGSDPIFTLSKAIIDHDNSTKKDTEL